MFRKNVCVDIDHMVVFTTLHCKRRVVNTFIYCSILEKIVGISNM
jgi:hypothetical protein